MIGHAFSHEIHHTINISAIVSLVELCNDLGGAPICCQFIVAINVGARGSGKYPTMLLNSSTSVSRTIENAAR